MGAFGTNSDANRVIICPACGLRYPVTARFCGQDGTVLTGLAPVPAGPEALKFCPSCKKVYPPYAIFCPADASLLAGSSQPAQSQAQNQPAAAGAAGPAASAALAQSTAQPAFAGQTSIQPAFAGKTEGAQAPAQQARPVAEGTLIDEPLARPPQSAPAQAKGILTQIEELARSGAAKEERTTELEPPVREDDSGDEIGFGGSAASFLQENQVIGKIIAGKYKVESLLGEGGMAQVFRATHMGLDRPVVIKLMHSSMPSMDTAMKRFEQECKVTAKIDHPNVVSVFDVGTLEGRRPFLVMEFIQGESLRDYLDREGSMSIKDATTVMMQVCSGLAEAHAQGIVHRDLKPENIMLRERPDRPDWVKIVDFGIAHLKQGGQRLTRTGIAIGTVDYMSPEYLSDKPIDHRSDIYALGIILYEMIAGRCPFVAETAEALMAKHLWGTPMPLSHFRPDLSPGCLYDQLVEKTLLKEPDDRFQSVTDMRDDLKRALKEYESSSQSNES